MSWVASRLDQFFFREESATPIAVLRIATGMLTFFWALSLLTQADPLLTLLRAGPGGEVGWWQFWPTAPDPTVLAMVVLLAISSALVTVGLWTKAATWASFALALVLQRYNPAAFNGGDLILRGVLLLGLAFAPAGAYLSIDSRRQKQQFWIAPLVTPWALRFIQLHISFGYILTVVLKLHGNTWPAGTAVWYALGVEDLTRFDAQLWINHPVLIAILTWSTLVVESAVGIGVWFQRTRAWVLLAGVALHLGIAAVYEIGFFSFIMIASYLAFLPPRPDVRALFPSVLSGSRDRQHRPAALTPAPSQND